MQETTEPTRTITEKQYQAFLQQRGQIEESRKSQIQAATAAIIIAVLFIMMLVFLGGHILIDRHYDKKQREIQLQYSNVPR